MADAKPEHYVRGQYEGYREIDGVRANSTTETFAALRLDIDSWRWAGVPFFIRTGKRLPLTQTELRLRVPQRAPAPRSSRVADSAPQPSQIVFRIDPHSGIRISLDALRADRPGAGEIDLDMEFAQEGGEGATPYEVLLHAALVGDSSHFTRQDNVEESLAGGSAPARRRRRGCCPTPRAPGDRRRPRSWSLRVRRLARAVAAGVTSPRGRTD